MENFPEIIFLYSLITREESAKQFSFLYQEKYFERAECGAIFQEIRAFVKKHGIPPSVRVIRKLFQSKDSIVYENRFKEILDEIDDYAKNPDLSEIAWCLDKAKDVATVRAFKDMIADPALQATIDGLDGGDVLRRINSLQKRFESTADRKTMNIREAIESLVREDGFTPTLQRVPTGINIIDQWCGGGLRPKQLGIIVGVTGHGKSATLVNIADRMARNEDKKVWLVTNELSLFELTERILSRISGINIEHIMNAPAMGLGRLHRQWTMNRFDKKLMITDYMRPPISSLDLEEEMLRNKNLYGFLPDILVLDFMERMYPDPTRKGRGTKGNEEWINLQFIAQDLISMAKRYNLIIWTAVQTNRGGTDADKIELKHVQASLRHVQEATAVIALRQRKIINEAGNSKVGIEFFNMKQRQAKLTFESVVLEADLAKMNITNTEAKVIALEQASTNPQNNQGIVQTAQQKHDAKRR